MYARRAPRVKDSYKKKIAHTGDFFCIYQKNVVPLQRNCWKEVLMTSTQPTFNQVFDMACMLPRQEQQMLLDKVAGRLYVEQLAQLQERRARIAESERQIAAGKVYSEEESDAMMDQIVDQLAVSVAV
jgi:hypothetical protein